MPVGRIVKQGGFKAVAAFYKSLGTEFEDSLYDMLVFDAVVKNVDRHYGNFGFIVQSRTAKIVAPSPLFDHGNSLYSLAGPGDFDSAERLSDYDKSLEPCVYDGFKETARQYMTGRQKERLRKLLDFRFKKHPRYKLDGMRLRRIEQQVRKNAAVVMG